MRYCGRFRSPPWHQKERGNDGGFSQWPASPGTFLSSILNLEERKLVVGSGDDGGVGCPNLEGRMSETLPMEGTGAMIPSRKLYTEEVGAATPIKRLAEVGSLSILSPPGSTTTRKGATPAGLGAARLRR